MEPGKHSKLGTAHKMYLYAARFKLLSVCLGLHLVMVKFVIKRVNELIGVPEPYPSSHNPVCLDSAS